MKQKDTCTTGEVAKIFGVSTRTIQGWDYTGKLVARRTPTNRRCYTQEDIDAFPGEKPIQSSGRKNVIYCRVSSGGQKDDLKNQKDFLRTFCNARGVIVSEVIEDTGSGLNYKRKKWLDLIWEVLDEKVEKVYVTHKDRLIRFGFSFFEELFKRYGAEIAVVENEDLSPTEEMVQDIISIIHVFSCRIYGLRKYKKKILEDAEVCHDKEKEYEDESLREEIQ